MLWDASYKKRRCVIFVLLVKLLTSADGFAVPIIATKCQASSTLTSLRIKYADDNADAEKLLAKARAIRDSIPTDLSSSERGSSTINNNMFSGRPSEFALPSDLSIPGHNYRLQVDIGRESGTWMDPRWGASGRRIAFTVDVSFPIPMDIGGPVPSDQVSLASDEISNGLMKSVTTKSNLVSPVYRMNCASYARLKGGFDKMTIHNGGYCIESSPSATRSSTLRFCLSVEGTNSNDASYGDVSIPKGNLFFALPYFGIQTGGSSNGNAMVLSTKEGTVTVKQMGWHTGWWREESRILGIFRAVSLDKSR
eukprot:CCRYP_006020-RA/>CCRYP_006020-RA protein AED:0.29 eAED:-0.67 QI:0/-1/0/1/-1/1/1/0/308